MHTHFLQNRRAIWLLLACTVLVLPSMVRQASASEEDIVTSAELEGEPSAEPPLSSSTPSPQKKERQWHITDLSPQSRSTDFSFMLGISSLIHGLGSGIRFAFPVVPGGFIDEINDAMYLELGGQMAYGLHGGGSDNQTTEWGVVWNMQVPVLLRWTFYIDHQWTVFASTGLSLRTPPMDSNSGFRVPIPWLAGGVGALYRLSEPLYLRLDVSSEITSIGLTWLL